MSSVFLTSQFRSQSTSTPGSGTAYFTSILKESGVQLMSGDEPNILTREQALVVRDIEKILDNNELATNIEKFINGFRLLCKKQKYFRKALLPTQLKKVLDEEMSTQNPDIQQESLIRILLRVNHIQNAVIDALLNEIVKESSEANDDTSWLRLLLNPLRYLPQIINAETLTTRLLDTLLAATYTSQLEILDSIPEILPDSEYDETTKHLIRLLDENEQLTGAIIDCLNALNLNADTRAHVQDLILAKILAGTSYYQIFPIVLEFLMTDYKEQNLIGIFVKIRNGLDKIMATATDADKEKESGKILIFNRLQVLTTTPKTVSDTWLTLILNINLDKNHKPIDLLLLFMLYSNAKLKKRSIELLFRKKIKKGLFKCSLIDDLFATYIPQQLLHDYFPAIVEIASSLLRTSHESIITEFASFLFKTLFNNRHTDVIYRQELLEGLIRLIGASDQRNVEVILKIFTDLLLESNNIAQIQHHHTVILMRLLEQLDAFELSDVKQVFEILSTLTCNATDETMTGYKDELHIIVRKQLSSSRKNVKYRGIVAAIVMIKHIATAILTDECQDTTDNDDEEELSITSINDLPQGRSKEAGTLLELTRTSTIGCASLLGLYYDQLAAMLMPSQLSTSQSLKLDKIFLAWLYEMITCDFQDIFITENICEPINDLTFTLQYNLNSSEEIDVPLAVNIAELTIKPNQSADNNSILLIASHFRLLRLLHYIKHTGDLSTIDALLGCSVILPDTDNGVLISSHFDIDQLKLIADCLFHCINWFREIISGFVTQKLCKLRVKIVQRLDNVIELEKQLYRCFEYLPAEHKLPICHFDTISQATKHNISPNKPLDSGDRRNTKVKRPLKKKLKPATQIAATNTTTQAISLTSASTSSAALTSVSGKTITTTITRHNIRFREIDIDIILLLKYPLIIIDDNNTSSNNVVSDDNLVINVQQLKFIMKDFVTKLEIVTKRNNNNNNNITTRLSYINNIAPLGLITDCVNILPYITKHFDVIIDKLTIILAKTDGCYDIPELFTDGITDIKLCYGLILECYALIFSWTGFQHTKRLDLFKNLLKSSLQSVELLNNTIQLLITKFVEKLVNCIDCCLHLTHAVSLIKIMQKLMSIVSMDETHKEIVLVSEKLLQRRWFNYKGDLDTSNKSDLDIIIQAYLNGASIKTICGLVGTLQNEQRLAKKETNLRMLPAINKNNFLIFYRGLWTALHSQLKIEIQSLTNNEHLILWRTTALTMQGLMTVAKTQEIKSSYYCFMKISIAILKIFLSQGIPILEIMLRSKPDQVVEIFKIIQTTTRFLHHVCCYSKQQKDTILVAYVPQFRLTLETLVYRVKATLVANNCSAAFWMGNLRNRNLDGEDIISQSSIASSTNSSSNSISGEDVVDDDDVNLDDNDDDLLPVDDDDSDSDIIDNVDSTPTTSDSQVF